MKNVEPKWFIYEASNNVNTKFTAKFVPLPTIQSKETRIRQSFCLSMFCGGVATNLGFCLDPAMHKRYQTRVCVGAVDIEYFLQYFGSTNHHTKSTRIQYLRFNRNNITIHCPSFSFQGYNHLPSLGCSRSYASVKWQVTTSEKVNDYQRNIYWYQEKVYHYRIYFSDLTFFCNPITKLVYVDFEFKKEVWNEKTQAWDVI